MRALLDVNVLIALFDGDHVSHAQAIRWMEDNGKAGWASCPITQNGFLRVMSQPGYPNHAPVDVLAARLRQATTHKAHELWADSVSLLDESVADTGRIHGPRQLTDIYLLALARSRGGRLVTFDKSIPLEAVPGAQKRHLVVI
jgi:toxin-antitoxin system PIN domain toxin